MTENGTSTGNIDWLSKIKGTMPDAAGQFGLLTIENEHGRIELKCYDPEGISELIDVLSDLYDELAEAQADHNCWEPSDSEDDPGERRTVLS